MAFPRTFRAALERITALESELAEAKSSLSYEKAQFSELIRAHNGQQERADKAENERDASLKRASEAEAAGAVLVEAVKKAYCVPYASCEGLGRVFKDGKPCHIHMALKNLPASILAHVERVKKLEAAVSLARAAMVEMHDFGTYSPERQRAAKRQLQGAIDALAALDAKDMKS